MIAIPYTTIVLLTAILARLTLSLSAALNLDILEAGRGLVGLLALLQEHGDRLRPVFGGPEHAVASPLVYLEAQATNEVLAAQREKRPRTGGGIVPVIPLRNTIQQLAGSEESLVAQTGMLFGLAFQGFG